MDDLWFWTIQLIGIIAWLLIVFSYYRKNTNKILVFQILSTVLWCLHYFLLGAYSGLFICMFEVLRDSLYYKTDADDYIFFNDEYKNKAIVEEIKKVHATGQPILVGTISIEKSESISHSLYKAGIKHNVLNAKNHEREAAIIAEAGSKGAVTIATNMAGRGTDILLGGNAEYLAKEKLDEIEKEIKEKIEESIYNNDIYVTITIVFEVLHSILDD